MSSNDEFKIQPHPQDNHSNTPAGSGPPGLTEGAAGSNPGPRILDNETASKLEKPKSKEELAKVSASLNDHEEPPTEDPTTQGQVQPPSQSPSQPQPTSQAQDDVPVSKNCCSLM